MQIKIRKLHADATVPIYATDGAAGFDLEAVEDAVIAPGETALVRTGLAFEIPEGYEMQIRPRSGISLRTKLRIANSPGTVDADFRGEVGVIVDNIYRAELGSADNYTKLLIGLNGENGIGGNWNAEGTYIIRKGDRIAQAVIAPIVRADFEIVDELTETKRGDGAFGSTGTEAVV